MIVRVEHIDVSTGNFEPVAEVVVEDGTPEDIALEQAFRLTQNIMGSWSRGETFEDGTPNEDYSSAVTTLRPLHVYEGKVYGLRSSMVGDRFIIGNKTFRCAALGFEEVI